MYENQLFDICEGLLRGRCVRYRDSLIMRNNTIKVIDIGDPKLARVCVNFCYILLPKTVSSYIERLEPVEQLQRMEITMLKEEAETIGVWLALLALGQESPRPDELLTWPSGDYAWTLRAAAVGKPERRFGC